MERFKTAIKGTKGFTLVELVVVIAILGVLAAITIPLVNNYLGSSKAQAYNVERQRIQDVVNLYWLRDRKSTRLNSSHKPISYAVFCLKKKKNNKQTKKQTNKNTKKV